VPASRKRVLRSVASVVTDENLDLYFLAAAALAFTVLGFLGVTSVAVLASGVLALLAMMALSQIRSRKSVATIAAAQRADPLALFRTTLTDEIASRRATATSFLFIGESMVRTVQAGRADLRRLLLGGGKLRVLLPDPDNKGLLDAADRLQDQRAEARIRNTLEELTVLRKSTGGQMEIRTCSVVPRIGVYVFNLGEPDGVVFVQHFEHRPLFDSAPVFRLDARDGFWYERFAAEANRMWEDGNPWPPAPDAILQRAPRPRFTETFGPMLETGLSSATDLLITGITRNSLVNSYYGLLEELLGHGCKIRFVVADPASEAVTVAASRYYAERSPDSVRERTRHALRLLAELAKVSGGTLAVRLTAHPMATGVIAVNVPSATPESAIFVEYYAYQARGDGPKFVLQSADEPWFSRFAAEAERIWETATPYALKEPRPSG
jgi:hypothetical protein